MTDAAAGTSVSSVNHSEAAGNSLVLAMVRRISMNNQGTEVLKPAAAMAEAGALRDMLNSRWTKAKSENGPLVQQVGLPSNIRCKGAHVSLGDRLLTIQD